MHWQGDTSSLQPWKRITSSSFALKNLRMCRPLFQLLGCPGVKGQGQRFDCQAWLRAGQPEAHRPSFYVLLHVWKGPDDFVTHLAGLPGEMSDSLEGENSTCLGSLKHSQSHRTQTEVNPQNVQRQKGVRNVPKRLKQQTIFVKGKE